MSPSANDMDAEPSLPPPSRPLGCGSILMGCLWLIVGAFLVVFMLACYFLGCDHLWRDDVVRVRIRYAATDPDSRLSDVYLYAGSEKNIGPISPPMKSSPLDSYTTSTTWRADIRNHEYLSF